MPFRFITKMLFIFYYDADPDDPLKTTDQTRPLGLIVGFLLCIYIIITWASNLDFRLMNTSLSMQEINMNGWTIYVKHSARYFPIVKIF